MRPRRIALVALCAIATVVGGVACSGRSGGKQAPPPPGELSFYPASGHRIAVEGDRLYRSEGAGVYNIDVTDPRNPVSQGEEAVTDLLNDVAFATGSDGTGPFGATLGGVNATGKLSLYRLPSSSSPFFLGSLPFGLVYGLASIPGSHAFAVSGFDSNNRGAIALVDDTAGVASWFETDYVPYQLASSSSLLFSAACNWDWESLSCTQPNSLVVYNVGDAASPVEIARIPFTDYEYGYRQLTVDRDNLIALDLPGHDDGRPARLSWYRIDPSRTSMTLLGTQNQADYLTTQNQPQTAQVYEDFVLLGTVDTFPFPHFEIYRLNTSMVLLQDYARVETREPVGATAIDTQRKLFFALEGDGIEVFDLGEITDGTPAWP